MQSTLGRAFLAVWHDVAPHDEGQFVRWHAREHMPDLLSTPGLLQGRRYFNCTLATHRWYCRYDASDLHALRLLAQRAARMEPSTSARILQPHLLNIVQCAFETVASGGLGLGGDAVTIRLVCKSGRQAAFRSAAAALLQRLSAFDGVIGAQLAWAQADVLVPPVAAAATPAPKPAACDAVVHLELCDRQAADAAMDGFALAISALDLVEYQLAARYGLAHQLDAQAV